MGTLDRTVFGYSGGSSGSTVGSTLSLVSTEAGSESGNGTSSTTKTSSSWVPLLENLHDSLNPVENVIAQPAK